MQQPRRARPAASRSSAGGNVNSTSLEVAIGPTGSAPGPTTASGSANIGNPSIALGADHPDTGLSLWHLAERAAAIVQRLFGADHPVLASTLALQARAHLALDEPDGAEALLRSLRMHGAAGDDGEAGQAAALADALLADARARRTQH